MSYYYIMIERDRSSPEEIIQTTTPPDHLSPSIHDFRTKCLRFIFNDPIHTPLPSPTPSPIVVHVAVCGCIPLPFPHTPSRDLSQYYE